MQGTAGANLQVAVVATPGSGVFLTAIIDDSAKRHSTEGGERPCWNSVGNAPLPAAGPVPVALWCMALDVWCFFPPLYAPCQNVASCSPCCSSQRRWHFTSGENKA